MRVARLLSLTVLATLSVARPTTQVSRSESSNSGDSILHLEGGDTDGKATCTAFQGFSGLIDSMMEPTRKRSLEGERRAAATGSNDMEEAVTTATKQWAAGLKELRVHLETTKSWSLDAQLKAIPCYLEYAFKVAAWLELHPAGCEVQGEIRAIQKDYEHLATLLYGGYARSRETAKGLITGFFPEETPSGFKTRYGVPEASTPLSAFVKRYDAPLAGGRNLFEENRTSQACGSGGGGGGGGGVGAPSDSKS